jgi:flagellar protein FlaG
MQSNASIDPIGAVAVQPAAASTASGDFHDSRFAQEAERAARYRLVIEEGPQSGSFIYKTLDRVTGEVIKQLPREQVVNLMQAARYSAGSVIDTKA